MGDVVFDLFQRPHSLVADSHKVRTINWELMLKEYFQPTFDSLEELREIVKELKGKPEQFFFTAVHKLGALRQAVFDEGICPICGHSLNSREKYKATSTSPAEYEIYCPSGCTI